MYTTRKLWFGQYLRRQEEDKLPKNLGMAEDSRKRCKEDCHICVSLSVVVRELPQQPSICEVAINYLDEWLKKSGRNPSHSGVKFAKNSIHRDLLSLSLRESIATLSTLLFSNCLPKQRLPPPSIDFQASELPPVDGGEELSNGPHLPAVSLQGREGSVEVVLKALRVIIGLIRNSLAISTCFHGKWVDDGLHVLLCDNLSPLLKPALGLGLKGLPEPVAKMTRSTVHCLCNMLAGFSDRSEQTVLEVVRAIMTPSTFEVLYISLELNEPMFMLAFYVVKSEFSAHQSNIAENIKALLWMYSDAQLGLGSWSLIFSRHIWTNHTSLFCQFLNVTRQLCEAATESSRRRGASELSLWRVVAACLRQDFEKCPLKNSLTLSKGSRERGEVEDCGNPRLLSEAFLQDKPFCNELSQLLHSSTPLFDPNANDVLQNHHSISDLSPASLLPTVAETCSFLTVYAAATKSGENNLQQTECRRSKEGSFLDDFLVALVSGSLAILERLSVLIIQRGNRADSWEENKSSKESRTEDWRDFALASRNDLCLTIGNAVTASSRAAEKFVEMDGYKVLLSHTAIDMQYPLAKEAAIFAVSCASRATPPGGEKQLQELLSRPFVGIASSPPDIPPEILQRLEERLTKKA